MPIEASFRGGAAADAGIQTPVSPSIVVASRSKAREGRDDRPLEITQ